MLLNKKNGKIQISYFFFVEKKKKGKLENVAKFFQFFRDERK